jgi:hypothetical protein
VFLSFIPARHNSYLSIFTSYGHVLCNASTSQVKCQMKIKLFSFFHIYDTRDKHRKFHIFACFSVATWCVLRLPQYSDIILSLYYLIKPPGASALIELLYQIFTQNKLDLEGFCKIQKFSFAVCLLTNHPLCASMPT